MYYCPRCGTENAIEASFCRNCGADISLVPQALTGSLSTPAEGKTRSKLSTPAEDKTRSKTKIEKAPTPEQFMSNLFIGLAFLSIVAAGAVFFRSGFMIWIWFIIPAFSQFGTGAGQYIGYRKEQEREARLAAGYTPPSLRATTAARAGIAESHAAEHRLRARDTEEIALSFEPAAHASVTEGTTRLLDDKPEPTARNAATRERG